MVVITEVFGWRKSIITETPKCWWFGAHEQTVIYLYPECRRWREEQRKLVRELGKQSISWQTRPEKKANKQAVGPLLKFLRSTEIGSREGAAQRELERELEWERKNDKGKVC